MVLLGSSNASAAVCCDAVGYVTADDSVVDCAFADDGSGVANAALVVGKLQLLKKPGETPAT